MAVSPNIFYTSAREMLTLLYSSLVKRKPFRAENSRLVRYARGFPPGRLEGRESTSVTSLRMVCLNSLPALLTSSTSCLLGLTQFLLEISSRSASPLLRTTHQGLASFETSPPCSCYQCYSFCQLPFYLI